MAFRDGLFLEMKFKRCSKVSCVVLFCVAQTCTDAVVEVTCKGTFDLAQLWRHLLLCGQACIFILTLSLKMKVRLGRSLMRSKFASKPRADKNSVVEHSNLASLQMQNVDKNTGCAFNQDRVHAKVAKPKHTADSTVNLDKVEESNSAVRKECTAILLNFSRCIPPRVPFNMATGPLYKVYERKIFSYWLSRQKPFPYERNLETWRQLWLTCERSDVIAQVLDARNPEFFFVEDLVDMYPKKKHVLLLNKSDLVQKGTELLIYANNMDEEDIAGLSQYRGISREKAKEQKDGAGILKKYEHVFYSSVNARHKLKTFLENFKGTKVAFVGYPNVGKSSTINAILKEKKVQTSQTPGKTKHLQSIVTGDMILIDCPGIVFPRHGKFELIINGVLNVDRMVDYTKFFQRLVTHIGEDVLKKRYAIKSKVDVESIWNLGGLDCGQLFKKIVKDYVAGYILAEY